MSIRIHYSIKDRFLNTKFWQLVNISYLPFIERYLPDWNQLNRSSLRGR